MPITLCTRDACTMPETMHNYNAVQIRLIYKNPVQIRLIYLQLHKTNMQKQTPNTIKLLSHTMKLWERVIDQRLRDIVSISDGQFGFKSGVGTTDAIFVIRILCEKYREGNTPLVDMVFVDLEKAYDTVPREVLWRCTVFDLISVLFAYGILGQKNCPN